jgi:hypothetical protein
MEKRVFVVAKSERARWCARFKVGAKYIAGGPLLTIRRVEVVDSDWNAAAALPKDSVRAKPVARQLYEDNVTYIVSMD